MNAKGKVAPSSLKIYPEHWDNTPITPSSEAPSNYTAAQLATFMGKAPPGFKPPQGSPFGDA